MRLIRARMAPSVCLIFLFMIQGVYSAADGWGVTYSPTHICALKSSTVIMNCTYKYPAGYQIKEVIWTNTHTQINNVYPNLLNDPEYSQRIQYVGDKHHDCTIRLTDVRHTDSHNYYFRFITDDSEGKWIGVPGVYLDITDLQLESSGERVIEGHSVTLTCKTTCSLSDGAQFIWIKNTQSLRERTDRNNQLILQSVKRDDAGDYRCAVQGHNLTSPARHLTVIYAPDNPVISIKPSEKIVEGESVNLTCSTDANPPAEFSWFKNETSSFLGSGNIYIISKISSNHSGEYKCKARNEQGQKYSTVTLNVLYPPKNVTASIISSGVIVEDDSVILTCSSESNPPVEIYSWFKENESSSVGSGQSFRALESGSFYCEAHNEVGSHRSAGVSVTVNHRSNRPLLVGITAACGGLVIIIILIIFFIVRKRRVEKTEDTAVNQVNQQDDLYCNMKHDDHVSESAHGDDVQYGSVAPKRLRGGQTRAGAAPESTDPDPEEIQYATVQYHKNTEMIRSEETENHYGNIRNDQPDADVRSNVEDTSVIYSSVK